jgi:hypothetical protein
MLRALSEIAVSIAFFRVVVSHNFNADILSGRLFCVDGRTGDWDGEVKKLECQFS